MEEKTPANTAGSKIATALGLILCIILIPLLIINLTIIVKSFVYPDKVPSFMGYKPFIVLSGSMEPAIMTGDIVLDKEVDTDTLKVGDIISYREGPNTVVTHRIKEIKTDGGSKKFITQGDANNAEDQNPVAASEVEGKVLANAHKLGDAAMFMQTKVGMLIFIAVPLVLLVLLDIFRRRKLNRTSKKETAELETELERMRSMLEEKGNAEPAGSEGGNTDGGGEKEAEKPDSENNGK